MNDQYGTRKLQLHHRFFNIIERWVVQLLLHMCMSVHVRHSHICTCTCTYPVAVVAVDTRGEGSYHFRGM